MVHEINMMSCVHKHCSRFKATKLNVAIKLNSVSQSLKSEEWRKEAKDNF